MTKHPRFSQAGFTLIEVLVSLIVLSVALLGLAHMQLAGLRFAQDATYRTQATILAADMVNRILANQAATGIPGGTESYADNPTVANSSIDSPLDCLSTECSAVALANYDVAVWRRMIANRIPSGSGIIESGDGLSYTITVDWWDRGSAGEELRQEQADMTIPTI
ncbi:MAG: type IV pilus modification protein PilV [Gammaproteobacteria bacterium]|nr:type IV pilus modification protein PilV [Gammaproteobacteria bacterium]